MTDDFVQLSVQTYSKEALTTARRCDADSLNFPLLGLFGEIGSLLSEVKKKQRDATAYRAYAAAVVEEFGDVLWYLNLVAVRGGLQLANIAANLAHEKDGYETSSDEPITFRSLQPPNLQTMQSPSPAFEATLIDLAAKVGRLMADQAKKDLMCDQAQLSKHLVAILETLVRAANEAGVTLEAAAVKNRIKIMDRWPVERKYPAFFDAEAPAEEQLPRNLRIKIFERSVGDKLYVFQTCNDLNIGDRLTDNAMTQDDYRFHDVFHYAYVAILGWSPVTRALFRLKRKSQPEIDEAEDGARAILIEEGVTTRIFGQAVEMDLFKDFKSGDLPFGLLKQVCQFVNGYEVDKCPAWCWEDAILQGYAAFRYLRKHRRGTVVLDAHKHRLDIEPLP